jgi:hypothetical protein
VAKGKGRIVLRRPNVGGIQQESKEDTAGWTKTLAPTEGTIGLVGSLAPLGSNIETEEVSLGSPKEL